jgi:hypothetical protein
VHAVEACPGDLASNFFCGALNLTASLELGREKRAAFELQTADFAAETKGLLADGPNRSVID